MTKFKGWGKPRWSFLSTFKIKWFFVNKQEGEEIIPLDFKKFKTKKYESFIGPVKISFLVFVLVESTLTSKFLILLLSMSLADRLGACLSMDCRPLNLLLGAHLVFLFLCGSELWVLLGFVVFLEQLVI